MDEEWNLTCFLLTIMKYSDKINLREKVPEGPVHHGREDMAAGREGRQQKQEVGWSHCICPQETEGEQEVRSGSKSLKIHPP